jgi:hypothetical protein
MVVPLQLQEAQLLLECACDLVCEAVLPRRLHVAGVQVRGDGSWVEVIQPDAAHEVANRESIVRAS